MMADANGEVFYEEIFTYDFLTFQKTLTCSQNCRLSQTACKMSNKFRCAQYVYLRDTGVT